MVGLKLAICNVATVATFVATVAIPYIAIL